MTHARDVNKLSIETKPVPQNPARQPQFVVWECNEKNQKIKLKLKTTSNQFTQLLVSGYVEFPLKKSLVNGPCA